MEPRIHDVIGRTLHDTASGTAAGEPFANVTEDRAKQCLDESASPTVKECFFVVEKLVVGCMDLPANFCMPRNGVKMEPVLRDGRWTFFSELHHVPPSWLEAHQ